MSDYLFTSKELDATGLYYYGARYYDPQTSVWQSTDMAINKYIDEGGKGGGKGVFNSKNIALYTYAYQNPVILLDPDGNITTGAAILQMGQQAADEGNYAGAYGTAVLSAAWDFFGSEGVSSVTDSLQGNGKLTLGMVAMAGLEVGTLGKGGKAKEGITVLGKYFGGSEKGYKAYAEKLGAKYFNPTLNQLSKWGKEKLWNRNAAFLEKRVAAGDKFMFNVSANEATGDFLREIDYLKEKGGTLSEDGMSMTFPKKIPQE
jgi:RHS repeat-associated protein